MSPIKIILTLISLVSIYAVSYYALLMSGYIGTAAMDYGRSNKTLYFTNDNKTSKILTGIYYPILIIEDYLLTPKEAPEK
jgi:hypothetical protein